MKTFPSFPFGVIQKDGDILWTMTSCGHFFSKWTCSHGHCQRLISREHEMSATQLLGLKASP